MLLHGIEAGIQLRLEVLDMIQKLDSALERVDGGLRLGHWGNDGDVRGPELVLNGVGDLLEQSLAQWKVQAGGEVLALRLDRAPVKKRLLQQAFAFLQFGFLAQFWNKTSAKFKQRSENLLDSSPDIAKQNYGGNKYHVSTFEGALDSSVNVFKERLAVISAKNHERQSVTAKREKSQTPKVLTAILALPNLT